MAEYFLEPQNPLKKIDESTGDVYYIYPETTAKQVKMDNGERLSTILNESILYLGDTEDGGAEVINADTLGGRLARYYTRPYNLLDNSDFRNPVNQRGATISTEWNYFIDRWITGSNGCTLAKDGITLVKNCWLFQRVAVETFDIRLKNGFTFCCELSNGTVLTLNTIAGNDSKLTNGVNLYIANDYINSGYYEFRIVTDANSTATIKWAALYEGEYTAETLPEYMPKGYAHELLECQRYYYQIKAYWKWVSAGICTSATECHIPIQFPVTMRVVPSVNIPDTSLIKIRCGAVASQVPSAISWVGIQKDRIQMTSTITGATNGNIAMLYFDNGGIIEFSADL